MSRAIVVWQETSTRAHSEPRNVGGLDVKTWREVLGERLAWVLRNARGEYQFDDEAKAWYDDWYIKFNAKLNKEVSEKVLEMQYRYDTHLIKVALLIRAQRYEEGRTITKKDLLQANALLESTFQGNVAATEDVGVSDYTRHYNAVARMFHRNPKRTRRQLIQALSARDCDADTALRILSQLHQAGRISIKLDGKDKDYVSKNGREVYFWREGGAGNSGSPSGLQTRDVPRASKVVPEVRKRTEGS